MRIPLAMSLVSGLSIVAMLGASVCAADTISSQPSVEATAVQPAAALSDQGLALIYGVNGQKADVAAGISLLEQAAAQGDLRATAALGRMLVEGYYVTAEPARGVALLESAAAAGDLGAKAALGEALLWGRAVPADPTRARALLEEAIAGGDAGARALLGEQLMGGWVMPRDTEAGRALLGAGVAAGEPRAETALSGLLLYGIGVEKDPVRARVLAEAAAAQGKPKALRQVGEMLMWSQRDAAGAEALLRRAGEMGDGDAWAILAEGAMYGYLGGGSASRAKFDGFATLARAAGNERIEVLDATRQMWGISMRASGPLTLERLQTAAAQGNGAAARFLVALLRDGNQLNVRRDVKGAEAALARHVMLIGPEDSWRLSQTIVAARARTEAAWAEAAAGVEARPELASKDFGRDLYKANPHVALRVLQDKLAAAGLYTAAPNGYATRATLRALNAACRQLQDDPGCDDSVMRPDILGAIFAAP